MSTHLMVAGDFDGDATSESPPYDALVEQRAQRREAVAALMSAAKEMGRAARILDGLGLDEDAMQVKRWAGAVEAHSRIVKLR